MPPNEDNSHYEKILATGEVKCIDDEIPFEIPKSWEWCRLGQIVQINPKNKANDEVEAAFIPMELIDATYFSSYVFKIKKWKNIKSGFTHFANGDIAFAKITPCFQNRKSMILRNLPNGIGAGTTELKVLRPYSKTINDFYLLFFLESAYFVEQAIFKGTANQQRIISGYMETKLFPLPPISEQIRIAHKLEELLLLADKYNKSQVALKMLDTEIPKLMKQSILQEAIQGRLVPQDSNDEPATVLLERIREEKKKLVASGKLKKKDLTDSTIFKGDDNKYYEQIGNNIVDITDRIPFDLPNNWVWVRHNQLFNISGGTQPPKSQFSTNPKEGYIQLYQIRDYGKHPQPVFIPYKNTLKISEEGDILLARYGASLGKVFFAKKGAYNVAIARVIPLYTRELINKQFIYWYYNSSIYQIHIKDRSRSAQAGFNKEDMADLFFPLPPLAEQMRIVSKITELHSKL